MKSFLKNIGFLTLSILMLTLAWPPFKFGFLAYIGFVPLFFFYESVSIFSNLKRYLLSFFGTITVLFLFPYISSYNGWGEYNDNIFMVILMCFLPTSSIVSLAVLFKNKRSSYLFFVLAWGTMEILQMNWELNSPLLMFGNTLSYFPSLIQHYSFWGVIGGSMYIIAINILIFVLIKKIRSKEVTIPAIRNLFLILIPTLISVVVYILPQKDGKRMKVALVLAHFDHFKSEYSNNSYLLIEKYSKLLKDVDLSKEDLVVFPESTIVNGGWIENLNKPTITNPMDALCPNKPVLFGSHMFSIYPNDLPEIPYYVRYDSLSKVYYKSHNCIVQRSALGIYSVRSKEKFVSFHEIIPYHNLLSFTKNWFNKDVNSTFLSTYNESSNKMFKLPNNINVYALMCFESFFSNMMVKQKEAHAVFILANESWNNQDKGKEQYFSFMTPKAIESGKTVVKVANCGYSGYINQKGDVIQKINYSKKGVYKLKLTISNQSSIYASISQGFNGIIVLSTILLFVLKFIFKKELLTKSNEKTTTL